MSDERHSSIPPEGLEDEPTHGAKKLVAHLLKRGIESGIGAFSKSEDTVRGMIEGLKIPKEMASLALEQMDETKNGLYRVVAKEVRDFLQSTNLATEMKKVLTGLAFEVKMEVRFKNSDGGEGGVRPDVNATVTIKDREKEAEKKRRRKE